MFARALHSILERLTISQTLLHLLPQVHSPPPVATSLAPFPGSIYLTCPPSRWGPIHGHGNQEFRVLSLKIPQKYNSRLLLCGPRVLFLKIPQKYNSLWFQGFVLKNPSKIHNSLPHNIKLLHSIFSSHPDASN